MFLRRPKLCAAMGISVGLDIYRPLPTAGHGVFQPRHNAPSTRASVIWHDFAVRIDDARECGKVLWNVLDGKRRRLWLWGPIHSIGVYHRVEATIKTGPIVQYYPSVVGPTGACVIIELHWRSTWRERKKKQKKFHEETIHILCLCYNFFLHCFFFFFLKKNIEWLWHLLHKRIQLVLE